jgi:DNA replication protein DnaC
LFIVVPDLLDHLRATYSPHSPATYDERFDQVRNTPLLILDDLGTQSSTEWAQEKLFQIFNHRYNARLPTVVTSNQDLEAVDVRIRSRFADPDLVQICTILAPDFRGSGADQVGSELSSLSLHGDQTFDAFSLRERELSTDQVATLQQAFAFACNYAENPEDWVMLTGGYGCGKTHLAAAIANYCLARGQPTIFIVVPDLLDHLRAAYSPNSTTSIDARLDAVLNAPLLILDDMGTQHTTPWAREKLYQLFNYRYNARLPTVITTNRPLEEIDPRLRSRMSDPELCQIYRMVTPDFRGSGHSDQLSSLHLYADKTFDTFKPRLELPKEKQQNLKRMLSTAKEFAKNPEGWLVFVGPYGCGKTHLAAAISNYRTDHGYPVVFKEVPDLLDHLRATYRPENPVSYDQLFEGVRNAPLLVLDDLGTESATDWAREKLYQIFNYRYNKKLPTVITASKQVEEADPRLASRMLDLSLCTISAIRAPGYHGAQLAKRGRKKTRKK